MKKLLVFALTGAMVLGSCFTAFADSATSTGTGAVEYDDSEDIEYDQVTLPTIGSSTYNMTLDPTGLLNTYDADTYSSDKTVYFQRTKTEALVDLDATIAKVGSGNKVYKLTKTTATADESTGYSAIVKTVADSAVTEVNSGYYLWVPDTSENTTITVGNYGKYLAITADNIGTYFDITYTEAGTGVTAVTMKSNHLAGSCVCDGNVYTETYSELTADFEVDGDDDYSITYSGTTASAVSGLYTSTDASTYTALAASNVVILAAETEYTDTTDAVSLTNKSTKQKTITANVTLSNISGLTIDADGTIASDDATASLWIKATNGSTTVYLTKASDTATTATATYTVNLAAADNDEITYQTTSTNTLGGHVYKRYEGVNPTYTSDNFTIVAGANSNDAAAEAWTTYATAATAAPTLSVVYSIEDYVDTVAVTFNANYTDADPATSTQNVPISTATALTANSFTRDGYTFTGWNTAADGTGTAYADGASVTLTEALTLYAQWTEDDAAPSIATTSYALTADTEVVVQLDLGSGSLAAAGSSVTVEYNGSTLNTSMWSYDSDEETITFTSTYVNALVSKTDVSSRTHTIVFDDDAGTTVDVTLTW